MSMVATVESMPNAPLRPCSGHCGRKVQRGKCKCPDCARHSEQRRGSASQRGYNSSWERFRLQYIALLVEHGILPICGAALPTGPKTHDSQCKQEGRIVGGSSLHLDHEPPLQDWERKIPSRVMDKNRLQILCFACHAAKTLRERATSPSGGTIHV